MTNDVLAGYIFGGLGVLFVLWMIYGGYALHRQTKRRNQFAKGEYAPIEFRIVSDLLNNINNYILAKPWADRDKFQCQACCCKKLKFTWKQTRLLGRLKDTVGIEIFNLLDSVDLTGDFSSIMNMGFLPTDAPKLPFAYLEGHCSSCGRYDGDYHVSGGHCGTEAIAGVA